MRDEEPGTVDLIGPAEEALVEHIAVPDVARTDSFVDATSGAAVTPECGGVPADDESIVPAESPRMAANSPVHGVASPQRHDPAAEIDTRVEPPDWPVSVVPTVKPPSPDDAPNSTFKRTRRRGPIAAALVACILAGSVGWQMTAGPEVCHPPDLEGRHTASRMAAETVARRIITAESGGDATATNDRSTATGAGQFLEATWLEMIDRYRPDLSRGSEAEILELRHDPDLSREMVSRFAEKNANMLLGRCLPVTPGTLYLSHFAGGGGAVAVLSAEEDADAATTMAMADSTGKTTRSMIVTANPFLRSFTVADLKQWAEAKMRGPKGQSRL